MHIFLVQNMHKMVKNHRTSPVIGFYAVTVQFLELNYVIRFAAETYTAAIYLIQNHRDSRKVGN